MPKEFTSWSAWADLARRPSELVNGTKKNFVGPIAYFRRGRRAPQ